MVLFRRLALASSALRYLGPLWAIERLRLALEVRSGRLARKLPVARWQNLDLSRITDRSLLTGQRDLPQKPNFFFEPASFREWRDLFPALDRNVTQDPISAAEAILSGRFQFFSAFAQEVGFPPRWNVNYLTGEKAPEDRHFSELSDFGYGDIKAIWELSRFTFAFTLVRAYARTGDDRYPEAFWTLFEDWCARNQPNAGVNWKCGQESAIRLFAWTFAYFAFSECQSSTPERRNLFRKAVFVTAERIRQHIHYALSQKNNHGISEAAGLFTAGLLFPEFRDSSAWKRQGSALLEKLGHELIYADGAFSQHSFNYERVALHVYHWAARLGELNNEPLSKSLRSRLQLAAHFLHQHQDSDTGSLPNYGHNDGALVLPLTNLDFRDFRPVVQAGAYLHHRYRVFGAAPSPVDEELLWLFGRQAVSAPDHIAPRTDFAARSSGYFVFRGETSFLFCRAPRFRHRPSQADLLHVDLWFKGINVAADPGTFSYNAPAPWNNSLDRTACHNTVTINGRDQMNKVSRFLWLPWAEARVLQERKSDQFTYFEAETRAYPQARHSRAIMRIDRDVWLVFDRIVARTSASIALHWLFPSESQWNAAEATMVIAGSGSTPHFYVLSQSDGKTDFSVTRCDTVSPRGWISPYYYSRQAATSLCATTRTERVLYCSVFSLTQLKVRLHADRLVLSSETSLQEAAISFAAAGSPIVTGLDLNGTTVANFG